MKVKTNKQLQPLRAEFIWVVLLVLVFSFILFGNVIKNGFVLDDHMVIEGRAELSNFWNLPAIFKAAWVPPTSTFRPLTMWSFAFNLMFSQNPAGFHIINILLHAANVILVFLLVKKFSSKRVAYLTSFLFLILPIHVEAVASIVGRKELLGTFFILLALILFFEKKHIKASIVFFLALLSNEFAIAFLPLLAVLLLIENPDFKMLFKSGWYYFIPLPIYFLMRFWALGKYFLTSLQGLYLNPIVVPMLLPFKERVFTGFYNFFLYLKKTVYPVDLSPDYSFNQIPAVHNIFVSPGALIGIIFFIFLVLLLVFLKRKDFRIALALFLITFLTMSDIIFISGGSMAERRWYLPSLGLILIVSLLVDLIISKWDKLKYALRFLGVVISLFFCVIIVNQNHIWLNDHDLFVAAAERSPNSVLTRTYLATVYFNEKNFDGAKKELKAALEVSDNFLPAQYIWGKLMWHEGNYNEAELALKKALSLDFDGSSSRLLYRTLALLSFDNGRNKEALSYMGQTLKSQLPINDNVSPQIDRELYGLIKKDQNRAISSYSAQEIQQINLIMKSLLGF